MKPSVGRIVHYVSHGSPVKSDGSQTYTSQCRAAIVTETLYEGDGTDRHGNLIGLAVMNPTGFFFNPDAPYHDGTETPGSPDCPDAVSHGNPFRYCACGWIEASHLGGTWHWPERVDD